MPNRLIRESILSSVAVNQLSAEAEVFYRRLMSIVDDYGRFEADCELLATRLYPRRHLTADDGNGAQMPADDSTCQQMSAGARRCAHMLAECTRTLTTDGDPLVTVYQVKNHKFLQINNFGQRIRTKSKYPAPSADNCAQMSANDSTCPQMSANDRLVGVGVGVGVGGGGGGEDEDGGDARAVAAAAAGNDRHSSAREANDTQVFFDGREPYEWFEKVFQGEIPDTTWRVFGLKVNTSEKLDQLRANTPLWMRTPKYRGGYGMNAIKFLQSGIWLKAPPTSMIEQEESVDEEEEPYRPLMK